MIDAELVEEDGYLEFGETPVERVAALLTKLDSDRRNETDHVSHKFMGTVERVFASLPRPVEWRSFYVNDLPLITKLDAEVAEIAVANRLNKSQAKALGSLKKNAPKTFEAIQAKANDDGEISVSGDVFGEYGEPTETDLSDLSARDMRSLERRSGRDLKEKTRSDRRSANAKRVESSKTGIPKDSQFATLVLDPPDAG